MHGMVTGENGELSSGKGDALLIDDLFDELAAHPQVTAAARSGEERSCSPDDLVAIALLGFCLDRPLVKRLEFAPIDALLNPDANIGWRIALAWSRAWDPANDAGEGDPANDADYRFGVLQSQLHRRMLAPAVQALDLLKFVRFLGHLSAWHLDAPADPRVGRAMRATLSAGLAAAGLLHRSQL
jgi:hypothetical protein